MLRVVLFLILASSLVLAQDLDLPILKPQPAKPPVQTPVTPAPPLEEPRDDPMPEIFGEEIDTESQSIVFVIDRSGSMAEFLRPVQTGIGPDGKVLILSGAGTPTRIEAAKQELTQCVSGLSPALKFNILAFDCTIISWSNGLRPADAGAKAEALAWIRRLQPGGMTATGPAVSLALRSEPGNLKIVLLTDGLPTCPFSNATGQHRSMISNSNSQRAQIDVFGIAPQYEWRQFCVQVASDSGGAYFDVQ